jgi:imidazolonepropionase-like amidohydrolase
MRKVILSAAALMLAVLPVAGNTLGPITVPPSGPGVTWVQAGRLIAEPGAPATQAQTIVVREGRIEALLFGYPRAPAGTAVIDLKDATVLPGLIDSHVHITSELGAGSRLNEVTKEESNWTLDGLVYAQRTLQAGFTTIADLGAGDGGHAIFALRDAIAEGRVVGPRIIASGAAISPTGGHGDVHGFRDDVMHVMGREHICDGADDCRRAVREMVRRGADIIKVTATGGVLSNTRAGLGQQFFDDELKAIADTAHALGRKVTAHAHGVEGINAALRAGFDSIEHGSYLDDTSIALFRQTGACLVPTVLAGTTVSEMAQRGGTLTPAQAAKALEVGPRMLQMARLAHDSGICVAFGTDSGVSRHGDNARELELMVQAGFSPAEALRSATVVAARHFELQDQIGRLAPGMAADIIAVRGDPLSDISVMRRVGFVMRAGTVARPWTP